MPRVAALGELARLEVYRLAGVGVLAVESDDEARTAWQALATDIAVVLLTPHAASALGNALTEPGGPMTVVLPS
jgi:vacuolar-type H+-ATPase subunit F/Vma7